MRRGAMCSLLCSVLAACGGDDAAGDGVVTDGAVADAPEQGDGGEPDGPSPDAPAACGTQTAPVAMISGTEGIAIAPDGTLYYSQSGGRVGRWQPGAAAPTNNWVSLQGATTVWGMALDAGGILYVATPGSGGTIWRIDPSAATPTATAYYTGAGSANGLTIGPDGAVYYSDFVTQGHVWRVSAPNTRTMVTATTINRPNGVLFDGDGTLLVLSYATGTVHRLTLNAGGAETDREPTAATTTGSPDGLARDAMGRYYVTDNGGGNVLRYDAQLGNREVLMPGVGAAANMAFGKGALDCNDLYVTSSGMLRRIAVGATGWP